MKHFLYSSLLWLALAMPSLSYAQFSMEDITYWVGSGSKSAVLVIDFNDGTNPQCFAWGYRFDGTSVTAQKMITDIDSADHALAVTFGAFLNDITYLSHAGLGGNPNYFATFSGDQDTTHWTMNMGCSEVLEDSMWFGLSYSPWDSLYTYPLFSPGLPVAASPLNGIGQVGVFNIVLYPNPVQEYFFVTQNSRFDYLQILDMNGRLIASYTIHDNNNEYSLAELPQGMYNVLFFSNDAVQHRELIIKE